MSILSICNWNISQLFGNYYDFLPITGDSAGGNIASAVSLKTERHQDGPPAETSNINLPSHPGLGLQLTFIHH